MPGGKGCPMKKSKNKYSPWPAVALCLVFLALRIVDLALFTDPETSFPTVGPSAARWGTALVGAAALLVMGRRVDEKIAPYGKRCIGIGLSALGPIDLSTGTLLTPTYFNNISNIPLKQLLEDRYSYPIIVDHDINAATIAEKFFGNARFSDNFVYLGVGQGISCGMCINGSLCKGTRGFCGEIGHCSVNPHGELCSCGNRGCLELYVSTRAILERVRNDIATGEKTLFAENTNITWEGFIQAVSERDLYAYSVLRDAISVLSNSVVTLINMLDPELIIIGDSLALGGEVVIDMLKRMIATKAYCSDHVSVPIQLSQLHDHSPAVGAACVVLNSLFNSEINIFD